jgi:uncharacterized protein (TIGR00369 family)
MIRLPANTLATVPCSYESLPRSDKENPMLTSLEKLNQALRENRPEAYVSPLHTALGMRPLQFRPGSSVWEWNAVQEHVLNPFQLVAGGYLAVFADEVLASALGSLLEEGEFATTAELKMSFLKPAAKGVMRGEGQVLRKGRRVAFVEATITNAQGEMVAKASSTWTVATATSPRE